jgi:hypothetical protein
MGVTIRRPDGRDERSEGRTISHDAFALLIFGERKGRKPIRTIPLDEIVSATADDGEIVVGRAKTSNQR